VEKFWKVAAYEGQDVMTDSVSVNPIEHTAGCLKSETRYRFPVDWTGTGLLPVAITAVVTGTERKDFG
jgi:hypothetical protein